MADRAVSYARVSGDDRSNEGRNLAGQLEMCREYTNRKGYQLVAELAEDDRGASGAEIDLPQLNAIRNMAQSAQFDVLIVREIDRLSRNLAKQLIVEEELKRTGVRIEYVLGEYPDTPEGNLMKHVKASVAEYEREKIKERISRGQRLKVKSGSVLILGGNAPLGYTVVQRDKKWTLEINETEAATVRLIFNWYTVGHEKDKPLSVGRITHKLNDLGIPSFADLRGTRKKLRGYGEWGRTSVTNILKNETYAGIWRFGKRPQRSGRKPVANEECLSVEVPAIISRETWEAAQARFAHNIQYSLRNTKYNYLMRRRVTCSCGLKMGCRTYPNTRNKNKNFVSYYGCPSSNPILVARECGAPLFRADHVDATIWHWVKHLLLDPERLSKGYAEYLAQLENLNAPLQQRMSIVEGLLAENRGQLKRLLDLYLSGDFDKRLLIERRTRLETTIVSLERERDELSQHFTKQTITDADITSLKEFAARVDSSLNGPDIESDFEAQRSIIDLLDVKARLSIEDEQRVVYVSCNMGEELLCICDNQTLVCVLYVVYKIRSA